MYECRCDLVMKNRKLQKLHSHVEETPSFLDSFLETNIVIHGGVTGSMTIVVHSAECHPKRSGKVVKEVNLLLLVAILSLNVNIKS